MTHAETVDIHSEKEIYIKGHDIRIEQNIVQEQQPQPYVIADLSRSKPPHFEKPSIADQWCDQLLHHRLLIFGGAPQIEKNTVARHLAWLVHQTLYRTRPNSPTAVKVLEWAGTDLNRIENELADFEDGQVIVFPRLEPHHIQLDLMRFHRAASRHYFVATTETPPSKWCLTQDHIETFWVEPRPDEVYSREYLTTTLLRMLDKKRAYLPQELLKTPFSSKILFPGNKTLAEIAAHLQTPDKIEFFVQLLLRGEQLPNARLLQQMLKQAKGEQHAVNNWYARLDLHQQLMGVALTIFEGLFEDQFFSALDELVQDVWRDRIPQLPSFDIHDLGLFSGYYDFGQPGSSNYLVQCFSRQTRRLILDSIWQRHQRLIVETLPFLVNLVRQSDAQAAGDHDFIAREITTELQRQKETVAEQNSRKNVWREQRMVVDLFGSDLKCRRLRQTVSETLNLVWLRSESIAEPILMKLAISDSPHIQAVAAETLAGIREHENGEEGLFKRLLEWEQETNPIHLDIDRLTKKNAKLKPKMRKSPEYIRSTLALTIRYAALYDATDQMAPELLALLKKLVDDPYPLVQKRFCQDVIPVLIPLHLASLKGFLFDWVKRAENLPYLAQGLAQAYYARPKDVADLLEEWFEYGRRVAPKRRNINKPATLREGRMATIALTLGFLHYSGKGDTITIGRAFDRLKTLFQKEPHSFVRMAVFLAIECLAEQHLNLAKAVLKDFAGQLTTEHFESAADIFCNIYLKQRQALTGGDTTIVVNEKKYEIWTKTGRPRHTEIETLMFQWLQDGNRPNIQQIAFLTFIKGYQAFDLEEQTFIQTILAKENQRNHIPIGVKWTPEPSLAPQSYFGTTFWERFFARLVTIGTSKYFKTLSGLIPISRKQLASAPVTTDYFLHRLALHKGHDLGFFGLKLRRIHRLVKWRFWIFGGVFSCLLLTLGFVF